MRSNLNKFQFNLGGFLGIGAIKGDFLVTLSIIPVTLVQSKNFAPDAQQSPCVAIDMILTAEEKEEFEKQLKESHMFLPRLLKTTLLHTNGYDILTYFCLPFREEYEAKADTSFEVFKLKHIVEGGREEQFRSFDAKNHKKS